MYLQRRAAAATPAPVTAADLDVRHTQERQARALVADTFALHLPVQRAGADADDADPAHAIHAHAARGVQGDGAALPHLNTIQRAFGHHDVTPIRAHVGGAAATAATAIGADAYATGDRVAFAAAPDLHTAAHEAAHVVQQRAGVQLYGGIGAAGDDYERHADTVADAVVRGESAAHLLDSGPRGGTSAVAVQLRGSHAAAAAVTPTAGQAPRTATSSRLLQSAATQLRALAMRLDPFNAAMLGASVSATDLIGSLAAAARQADEASGDRGQVPADEIENVAAAGRELALALPAELRKDPAVGDALAALQSSIGDLATAAGASLPVEPMAHKPGMDNAQQADLARTMLGEASAALSVQPSGTPEAERRIYARAAAVATDKLRIAADLIETHVPRGSRRVELAPAVESVSAQIARVDQWARAMGGAADAAIAGLFANERTLRNLTGLVAAPRVAVGSVDADTTTDRVLDGGPAGLESLAATVDNVHNELQTLLTRLHDAIATFEAAANDKSPAPEDKGLAEKLIGAAVGMVLGGSFPAALARGLVALGAREIGALARGVATDGAEGTTGEIALKALETIIDHKLDKLAGGPVHSMGSLLMRYVVTLRHEYLATQLAILNRFSSERPNLERAHPDSLRAMAARIRERGPQIEADVLGGYALAWQTLRARAVGGVPDALTTIGDVALGGRGPASTYDAKEVVPAVDMRIPGVLHLDFPIPRANPRAAKVTGPGRIEGITAANLEQLASMSARPTRDLHLNTIIQVRYDDMDLGILEIAWHPDGDTIDVAWFRGTSLTHDLTDAHHLKAYALGLPVASPELDKATAADALRGARMIADAALATLTDAVLPRQQ